ncbi:MAG TPA: pectinesterase family protein [Flavisolibacter sp.]|jgi:pectinesterase|nr:pectinesterase family protein [Flavisolibacter sp.]
MKQLFLMALFWILSISCPAQKRIVVAQDGSGAFTSVQAALNAIPSGTTQPVTLFIRKGIYKEVIIVDATKSFITLEGEDKDQTVLTYDHHAGTRLPNGDTLNTWTCASVFIYGNDIRLRNLTIQNTAGFTAGQAVALRAEGNRIAVWNCRITGFQDVLFLSGSGVKHYFRDCSIEGTTDFIFGAATAVFRDCHIHSKKNSHVTAASTNSIIPYGFVFMNCRLTADSNVTKVSLGRPWSPTASVTYLNCYMGAHIIPEGWNNWKNEANEKTARYAEYQSTGPGAQPDKRVSWSHQLTREEAKRYTVLDVLGTWNPEKEPAR